MAAPNTRRRTSAKPAKPAKPARPAKSAKTSKPTSAAAQEPGGKPIGYELVGLGLVTLGILLLLATTSLHGAVPDALLTGLRWAFGVYGAWGIAVAFILLGLSLLIHLSQVEVSTTSLGMTIVFIVVISLLQLRQDPVWNPHAFSTDPGGLFGGLLAGGLKLALGDLAWVVLIGLGMGGVAFMTDMPLWMLIAWPFRAIYRAVRWVVRPAMRAARERRDASLAARVAELQEEELQRRNRPDPLPPHRPAPKPLPAPVVVEEAAIAIPMMTEPDFQPMPLPAPALTDMAEPDHVPAPEPEHTSAPEPAPAVVGVPSRRKPGQLEFDEAMIRPYTLPPTDILTLTPRSAKEAKDDRDDKITTLEETLHSFGIDAKVVAVERGPRVTRFEMVPPPGVRISRITNLADNIALSLAALDVRVEAPVPGKGVVGIEVPNKDSVVVDLREILESDNAKKGKTPVTFALGKDIAGVPRLADLTRMPHLLIAGATNSGKSVCINTLICSILLRATPQQVKFLMVDPKRVELSLYQNIPHLIAPVAYDAKHAAGLLRWAIREMEQRYEMFAEKGVRNIIGFNEQSRMEGLEELPYIVIIIDELADLMMQAAGEFEASICRIAQLARATGMHLVVATQRPSVNVITGTIKANIPSRIAFAVASQVDSRTILDMNGAERLVGQGDMLYLPVDASKPTRIQGAYVSEKDINKIVDFVRTQGKPNFTDEIMAIEDEALRSEEGGGGNTPSDDPEDEFFSRALDYVRTTKYASTSMLQRKFRIGYTRAARIMDKFEELGYVGPGQGSKPREVIFAPTAAVVTRPKAEEPGDDLEPDDIVDPFAEED